MKKLDEMKAEQNGEIETCKKGAGNVMLKLREDIKMKQF